MPLFDFENHIVAGLFYKDNQENVKNTLFVPKGSLIVV